MANTRDPISAKAMKVRASCRAYLKQHFSNPKSAAEADAKRIARRALQRLESAVKARNLEGIVAATDMLDKAMVYLWAVKQFPKRTEKQ